MSGEHSFMASAVSAPPPLAQPGSSTPYVPASPGSWQLPAAKLARSHTAALPRRRSRSRLAIPRSGASAPAERAKVSLMYFLSVGLACESTADHLQSYINSTYAGPRHLGRPDHPRIAVSQNANHDAVQHATPGRFVVNRPTRLSLTKRLTTLQVRCDAASLGIPCTNCTAFSIECRIPQPKRKKTQTGGWSKDADR